MDRHDAKRQRGRATRSLSRLSMLAVAAPAMAASVASPAGPAPATLVVAARNSSARSKALADYVGDGSGDQEQINAAIQALPKAGGTVLLMEGTYDIRRVEGTLGGVTIDRSDVVLAGQGAATRLVLAPDQNTNVIRIIGARVGRVTIRDLYVDGNRDANPNAAGDPNISHARFEFCGIKAYYTRPGGSADGPDQCHDITVRNTCVVNARALGIMLEGRNMKVVDNTLGNATSDSVEILTGPGEIRGNYVEITGRTHVAIGSDRADSVIMAGNTVHVRPGGDLDIGFRSWANSQRHVIADNVLTVDPEGRCAQAMDVRGAGAVVTGNAVHTSDPQHRLRLTVSAGGVVITGNVFQNVVVEVDDQTDSRQPILVVHNIMDNSAIDHKKGNLVTLSGAEDRPAVTGTRGEGRGSD